MLNKLCLYICIVCVLSIVETEGVEVGFSVSDGTESVDLYTSYSASDSVSVNEEATGSFYGPGITDRREASGCGDLLATQAFAGSSGYTGQSRLYASEASRLALTSSASTYPAMLSLVQEALVNGAVGAGFDVTARREDEQVVQTSKVKEGSISSTQGLQLSWDIRSKQDTIIEGTYGSSTALAQDGWMNQASTELGMTDGRLMTEIVAREETLPFVQEAAQIDMARVSQVSTASGDHIWANTKARDQQGNAVQTDLDGIKGSFSTAQEGEAAFGATLHQHSEMIADEGSTGSASQGLGGYESHIKTGLAGGCMTTDQWAFADASSLVLERSGLVGVDRGSSESSAADGDGNRIDAITQADMDDGNFLINQRVWSDPTGSGSMRWIDAERALSGLSKISAVDFDGDSVEAEVTARMDLGLFSTSQNGSAAAGKATADLQASASQSFEGKASITATDADGNSVESEVSADMNKGLFSNSLVGEADGSAVASHLGRADRATNGTSEIYVVDSDGDLVESGVSAQMDEGIFSTTQEGRASAGKATAELQANASQSLEGEAGIVARDASGNEAGTEFASIMDRGLFSNAIVGEADGSAEVWHQALAERATSGEASSYARYAGGLAEANLTADQSLGEFSMTMGGRGEDDASGHEALAYMVDLIASGDEIEADSKGQVAGEDSDIKTDLFKNTASDANVSGDIWAEANDNGTEAHQVIEARGRIESLVRSSRGAVQAADLSYNSVGVDTHLQAQTDAGGPYSDRWTIFYLDKAVGTETIQSSVDEAYDHPSNFDTIDIAAGEYHENVHADKSLHFIGDGSDRTIVDGDRAGRVFTFGAVRNDITVDMFGMGIRNGFVRGADETGAAGENGTGGEAVGGGIWNGADLTLNEVNVTGNGVRGGDGRGGDIAGAAGETVTGGDGFGGRALGGGIYSQGCLTLVETVVSDNHAVGGDGFGGEARGGDGVDGDDSHLAPVNGDGSGGGFEYKKAGDGSIGVAGSAGSAGGDGYGGAGTGGQGLGGGVYSSNGALRITDSLIAENSAEGGEGVGGQGIGGSGGDGGDGSRGGNGGDASVWGIFFGMGVGGAGGNGGAGAAGAAGGDGIGGEGKGGLACGGGILSDGTLFEIDDSQVLENVAKGGDATGGRGQGGIGGAGGVGKAAGDGGEGKASPAVGLFVSAAVGTGGDGGDGGAGGSGGAAGDGRGGQAAGGNVKGGGICSLDDAFHMDGTTVSENDGLGGQAQGGEGVGGRGGDGGNSGDAGDGGKGTALSLGFGIGFIKIPGIGISASVGLGGDGGDGGSGGFGGAGGDGIAGAGNGGSAYGGGIFAQGEAEIARSHVCDNAAAGGDGVGGKALGGIGGMGSSGSSGGSSEASATAVGVAIGVSPFSFGGAMAFGMANPGDGGAGAAGGAGGVAAGGAAAGGAALGGGILGMGDMTVSSSEIEGNRAAGGSGTGGRAEGAQGGAGGDGNDGGSGATDGFGIGVGLDVKKAYGAGMGGSGCDGGDGGSGGMGGAGGKATGGSGIGGQAMGGGLYSARSLTDVGSSIQDNQALGGSGTGGAAAGGFGGAGGDGGDGGSISKSEGGGGGVGISLTGSLSGALADLLEWLGVDMKKNPNKDGAIGAGVGVAIGGSAANGLRGGQGAEASGGAGIGGEAVGGGIYAAGSTLSMSGSEILGNEAIGGAGTGGEALGGAGGDAGAGGAGGDATGKGGGGGGFKFYTSGAKIYADWPNWIPGLPDESSIGIDVSFTVEDKYAYGVGLGLGLGGDGGDGSIGGAGGSAEGGQGAGGSAYGGGIYSQAGSTAVKGGDVNDNLAQGGLGVGGRAIGGAGGLGGTGGAGGTVLGACDANGVSRSFDLPGSINHLGMDFGIKSFISNIIGIPIPWFPIDLDVGVGIKVPAVNLAVAGGNSIGVGVGIAGEGGDGVQGGSGGYAIGGEGDGGDALGGGIYSAGTSTLSEASLLRNRALGGDGSGGLAQGGIGGIGGQGGEGGSADSRGTTIGGDLKKGGGEADGGENLFYSLSFSVGGGLSFADDGGDGGAGGSGGAGTGGNGVAGLAGGGGIYNGGNMVLTESLVQENWAIGGKADGGSGQGGAGSAGGEGGLGGAGLGQGMGAGLELSIGPNLGKAEARLKFNATLSTGGFAGNGGDGGAGGIGGAGTNGISLGGDSLGGGIFDAGTLNMDNSTASSNHIQAGGASAEAVQGGSGGAGGDGGSSGGESSQGPNIRMVLTPSFKFSSFEVLPSTPWLDETIDLSGSLTGEDGDDGNDGGNGGRTYNIPTPGTAQGENIYS